jgi:superfamily II DNA or RNA helicase
MERRYLVAALAIIATFAVFSRGFRTLEHVSLLYGQHAGAGLRAKCNSDASTASRFMGKVRTHLRPGYPEEAQLLAEMNLPIAMAQAKIAEKVAEQVARQNMAAAQCARATAQREAERAQREAERARREARRMRDKMARTGENVSAVPIMWETNVAAEVDQQVRAKAAALAERIAAQ